MMIMTASYPKIVSVGVSIFTQPVRQRLPRRERSHLLSAEHCLRSHESSCRPMVSTSAEYPHSYPNRLSALVSRDVKDLISKNIDRAGNSKEHIAKCLVDKFQILERDVPLHTLDAIARQARWHIDLSTPSVLVAQWIDFQFLLLGNVLFRSSPAMVLVPPSICLKVQSGQSDSLPEEAAVMLFVMADNPLSPSQACLVARFNEGALSSSRVCRRARLAGESAVNFAFFETRQQLSQQDAIVFVDRINTVLAIAGSTSGTSSSVTIIQLPEMKKRAEQCDNADEHDGASFKADLRDCLAQAAVLLGQLSSPEVLKMSDYAAAMSCLTRGCVDELELYMARAEQHLIERQDGHDGHERALLYHDLIRELDLPSWLGSCRLCPVDDYGTVHSVYDAAALKPVEAKEYQGDCSMVSP